MRVAFLVGGFPVLSKTFILDQITGLIDHSVKVDVFAVEPEEELKIHPNFYQYNLQSRIIYPLENLPSKRKRLFAFPQSFFSQLQRNPKSVFKSLNFIKYGKRALSLSLFYEVLTYLQREKYDIIHAHFGPYGIKAQQLREIGALQGKLITSFHGFDISSFLKTHGDQVYRDLFANGNLFLPISNYWREKLIRIGCDRNKSIVHHMGINCRHFKFSPKKKIGSVVRLLSVARLIEKKGLQFSIKAVSDLLKKNKKIIYNIVGNGPLKQTLQNEITELGVGENVKLLGWKDSDEIRCILEDSDIFLAPSITASNGDMEGIPMVLMEAMAVGIHVISTFHSGIPELIEDGETGFLVPEKNVQALSEKIEYLIKQPAIWQLLTTRSRQYVEKYFNIDNQNDKLLQHYKHLLS